MVIIEGLPWYERLLEFIGEYWKQILALMGVVAGGIVIGSAVYQWLKPETQQRVSESMQMTAQLIPLMTLVLMLNVVTSVTSLMRELTVERKEKE